jgi:nucleoside-diphosphate-sugar epimerase
MQSNGNITHNRARRPGSKSNSGELKDNAKIVVTGATGFIGSRLALRLLQQGLPVMPIGQANTEAETRNCKMLEEAGAQVILCSITDGEQLAKWICNATIVFHLAAAQHEANVPEAHFWSVNVQGTRNLLDACVAGGVRRFVYGSTIGVYGSASNTVLDEWSPVRPDNSYGRSKLEAEELVRSYHNQLSVVIARISETYGPGDRRLLKLFRGIRRRTFFILGDGANLHHLIYIDDLLDGLILAAENENADGQTFVLAGKEPVTTAQMAATIAGELGIPLRGWHGPLTPFVWAASALEVALRPLGIQPPLHQRRMDFFRKSFVFSYAHASAVLGFSPRHSFQDGVAATAKWYTECGDL